MLSQKMKAETIPGLSIAIVKEGEIIWSAGLGMADLENKVRASATTVYRSASIGKSMTATAVMKLVEQGKLDLNLPIQNYCPSFPEKKWPITTRHLLNHTSGIRHYGGPRNQEELFNVVHYKDVIQPLSIFKNDPLLFEPGTAYNYSTFGYNVLGCIVEGASGDSFMNYMTSRIFLPAGMNNTRDDDPFAIIDGRARGYVLNQEGILQNSRAVDMSSKLPAGGYITTVEDLARFSAALMSGLLIDKQSFEMMITPQRLKNGEQIAYGLGWGLFPDETWYGEREAFHGGGTPQVSGILYLLPDSQFAIALIANREGINERTALAADIARIVLDLGK